MENHVLQSIQRITFDRNLKTPLHLQLGRGIEALVMDGTLQPGDRLPNVADLSVLCGISKGTAVRAVEELRRRLIVTAKRRSGIHVAEPLNRAVEILFCNAGIQDASSPGDFMGQLLDGLRIGYDDPQRRFVATIVDGHALSVQGLLAAAEARAVDSMVVYRPDQCVFSAVSAAARVMPCVSLVRRIPDSRVACVAFSVEKAVEQFLSPFLEEGAKVFAYVGQFRLLKNSKDGYYSPYRLIYEAALDALAEKEIGLTLCLANKKPYPEDIGEIEDRLVKRAKRLPDGAVVLAQTGTLARKLSDLDKGFHIATYTEYGRTLKLCRSKATVIYGGLDFLGRAAAEYLKKYMGQNMPEKQETVLIEPQVVEKTESQSGI